jgi:hypothetical protein
MASVAGIDTRSLSIFKRNEYMSRHFIEDYQTIKVKGAGTVKVVNGDIEEITTDSGHFKPNRENLKITLKLLVKKGLKTFPPYCDQKFDFKPVWDSHGNLKNEVYKQGKLRILTTCEL